MLCVCQFISAFTFEERKTFICGSILLLYWPLDICGAILVNVLDSSQNVHTSSHGSWNWQLWWHSAACNSVQIILCCIETLRQHGQCSVTGSLEDQVQDSSLERFHDNTHCCVLLTVCTHWPSLVYSWSNYYTGDLNLCHLIFSLQDQEADQSNWERIPQWKTNDASFCQLHNLCSFSNRQACARSLFSLTWARSTCTIRIETILRILHCWNSWEYDLLLHKHLPSLPTPEVHVTSPRLSNERHCS